MGRWRATETWTHITRACPECGERLRADRIGAEGIETTRARMAETLAGHVARHALVEGAPGREGGER